MSGAGNRGRPALPGRAWHGRGALRVALEGDRLLLRHAGLTTSTQRLKATVAGFFRKELRHVGPTWQAWEVHIWIEQAPGRGAFDVDNVAKACLDGLQGVLWHDDRQVRRLTVAKLAAAAPAITLLAMPLADDGEDARALARLLAET